MEMPMTSLTSRHGAGDDESECLVIARRIVLVQSEDWRNGIVHVEFVVRGKM